MAIAMELEENFMEFTQSFLVTENEIDRNNHLNNVKCVQWIQDIAVEHSHTTGGTAKADELGVAWMVRVQHVEYKNQAFLGDEIIGTTWVKEYSKVACNRCSKFVRKSDNKEIFSAVSTWVLVNKTNGRPTLIEEDMKDFYRKHS